MMAIIKAGAGGYYKPARVLNSFTKKGELYYSVRWDNLGSRYGYREKIFPAYKCQILKSKGIWKRFLKLIGWN